MTFGSDSIEGVRLIVTGTPDDVHLMADVLPLEIPVSQQVFYPFYRGSAVVVTGKKHKPQGVISGEIVDLDENGTPGDDVTAKQWATRLETLIDQQSDCTIALSSRDFQATSIVLLDGCRIELVDGSATSYYLVSLPFVEVS